MPSVISSSGMEYAAATSTRTGNSKNCQSWVAATLRRAGMPMIAGGPNSAMASRNTTIAPPSTDGHASGRVTLRIVVQVPAPAGERWKAIEAIPESASEPLPPSVTVARKFAPGSEIDAVGAPQPTFAGFRTEITNHTISTGFRAAWQGEASRASVARLVELMGGDASAIHHKIEREARAKAEVEAKNHAEALVHMTEKTLAEHGSKVGEGERRAIENAMADLKEALKGSDAEAITAKANVLQQASMKLGEAMYKQSADQQPGGGDAEGAAGATDGKKEEDVVDAEFTEVDDDKKNKKSA